MSDGAPDLPSVSIALASLMRALEEGGGLTAVPDGDPPAAGPSSAEQGLPERYTDLGPLGIGGMGEVRRVLDRRLNRPVAMKIIRPSMVYSPEAMARFLEEAQLGAQLAHPGIVPVYDAGRLADGRAWFTMKEVQGRTLGEVIHRVHRASVDGRWQGTADGWSLRRLVDALHRVCEAMAYAHARGVIHRDLKPGNVMIGAFGEVLVLDWGLGKVLGGRAEGGAARRDDPVRTERTEGDLFQTQAGDVGGTVMYMPPEQARGDLAALGPATDVYALGAMLHHVLADAPPYAVASVAGLLRAQQEGPPAPPGPLVGDGGPPTGRGGLPVPRDLWAICARTLAFDPADRQPDAATLAAEIGDWLEGSQRRERALLVVREADELRPRIVRLRERSQELRERSEALLREVPPLAPVAHKRPAWHAEAEADALAREADLAEERMVQSLHAALSHQPDLPEAHQRLAAFYRRAHAAAEARGDLGAAARFELRLRAHDDGEHATYLAGDGSLSLLTEPPGAQAVLMPLFEVDRRLVPRDPRLLGRTPLFAATLPRGRYLVELRAAGRQVVRYPVAIGRLEHWHGVAPGASAPHPILLPPEGAIGPDEVYVPAGWCQVGGDPAATRPLPGRRLWVDGFVLDRHPVTNREYLAFLDDLVARGDLAAADDCIPRERSARQGVPGAPVYARDEAGRHHLVPDAEGDTWDLDWPVVLVPWTAARDFAAWRAARTGLPWRLPSELEWEKAARGVDGRAYPWGEHLDLTWCLTQDSHAGRMMPTRVQAFPEDVSIYGARGMGGNVRDWCREADGETERAMEGDRLRLVPLVEGDPDLLRLSRGGCWYSHHRDARTGSRVKSPQAFRAAGVGIRLARSLG
ncbi:bifunctional serine/threonine-protein kinase/formylglycine-generating enzyme family protein [Myxococcota bacterium]|nr:bifunctional serine/threonine-protein kinase/formylglycine-generating enzyme family protein [Myxococcota bacterium]